MIVTLAIAKGYIGVSVSTEDTEIAQIINDAGAAMEAFCSRNLESATVIEYLSGDGTRTLLVREPAEGITSIYVDSTRAWGATSLVSSADYQHITGRDGTGRVIEYLDNVWGSGQRNIKATYLAGYAAMPDDIERACLVEVARLYSEWKRAKEGKDVLASQSVAGWTQQWLAKVGIDPACADLLRPYGNARL